MDKNKNITRTLTVTSAKVKVYSVNSETLQLDFEGDADYVSAGFKKPEKVKEEVLKDPENKGKFVKVVDVTYSRTTYSLPTKDFVANATVINEITLTAEELEAELKKEDE